MDEKLLQLGDEAIKDKEYEELFPDTPVEQAKQDKEKIKEALFQVHYMVYNKNIHETVINNDENYHVQIGHLRDMCDNEKEFERVQKLLEGATITEDEDGNTLIPKTDLRDVLRPRPGLMD